jgi:hypothetical protein
LFFEAELQPECDKSMFQPRRLLGVFAQIKRFGRHDVQDVSFFRPVFQFFIFVVFGAAVCGGCCVLCVVGKLS